MSTPTSLASTSQRLTTTSTLLLERSRVLSLSLNPSASSQTQIVRNLTAIRTDLAKLSDQLELESSGLVLGGKKRGKGAEGEVGRQVHEMEGRYDRLLEMFGEDEVGREKAKTLRRGVSRWVPNSLALPFLGHVARCSCRRPSSPVGVPVASSVPTTPKSEESRWIPPFSVEPPTPGTKPFKDVPDYDGDGDDRPVTGRAGSGEDDRSPHEMMSEQELMMDGESHPTSTWPIC